MIDIDGFRNYLYEEELSKNTVATYIKGLEMYAERYNEITKPNLIEFKRYLLENFKAQTVNLRIAALTNYCKYKGLPERIKLVKEQKKTHVENIITEGQYKKLMHCLKKDNNQRWYYNILLLAKTGMRISEALKVTKKDILMGKVSMHSKGHMRTIYFPKSLIEEMKDYLKRFDDNEIVMQNHWGKPITSRGVSGKLQDFAKLYDIPKENLHPHAFRHFFAIEFLKRNSNIALLADLLGHSSVKMTQIYLRQSQEQQQQAVDKAVNW